MLGTVVVEGPTPTAPRIQEASAPHPYQCSNPNYRFAKGINEYCYEHGSNWQTPGDQYPFFPGSPIGALFIGRKRHFLFFKRMVTTLLESESMLRDTIAGTYQLLVNIGYNEAIGYTIPVVLSNSEGPLCAAISTGQRNTLSLD